MVFHGFLENEPVRAGLPGNRVAAFPRQLPGQVQGGRDFGLRPDHVQQQKTAGFRGDHGYRREQALVQIFPQVIQGIPDLPGAGAGDAHGGEQGLHG